ncbi:MAG: hypothetical protein ACLRL4_04925 [Bifidobacterium bifidum]
MDCLSKADFGDRLKTLPDGLDTPLYKELDKNGVEVSGGEAQKIDIAGDKTAAYISHRLSSCKFCDDIAVFDHGAIVQYGTRDQLVADENGKYYELWACAGAVLRQGVGAAGGGCIVVRRHGRQPDGAAHAGRPVSTGARGPVRAAAGRSGRRARRRR